jgi:hypothetical protein
LLTALNKRKTNVKKVTGATILKTETVISFFKDSAENVILLSKLKWDFMKRKQMVRFHQMSSLFQQKFETEGNFLVFYRFPCIYT